MDLSHSQIDGWNNNCDCLENFFPSIHVAICSELIVQREVLDGQIAIARKAGSMVVVGKLRNLTAGIGFSAQRVFLWNPATKKVATKCKGALRPFLNHPGDEGVQNFV